MHCCNPSSKSVAGLQQFEIFEAILGEMTGGREAGDAAPDDDVLVVVLQVLRVLLRHDDHLSKTEETDVLLLAGTADGSKLVLCRRLRDSRLAKSNIRIVGYVLHNTSWSTF